MNKLYIYSFSNYNEIVKKELSNKKSFLKKRINRSDNFINLALLGAEQCVKDNILDINTNLYMASNNGNMNASIKVLNSIFKDKKKPMPFNFLNSVNASILFFIAKSFNIEGKAIFTDIFESALPQAYIDTINGKEVLIGVVNEAISDLELHKEKFKCKTIEEHSRWLLLSSKVKNSIPLATIEMLKFENSSLDIDEVDNFFHFLEKGRGSYSFKSNNLSFVVTKST